MTSGMTPGPSATAVDGPAPAPAVSPARLEDLPKISALRAKIDEWLARIGDTAWFRDKAALVFERYGIDLRPQAAETILGASGLNRPGMIAQFALARRGLRFALGVETALVHALVDRLLGFTRDLGESHYQITPVEWGVGTFIITDALCACDPEGTSELSLDRVGPDPFAPRDAGSMVTLRWPIGIGSTIGSVRVWLPRGLIESFLETARPVARAVAPGFAAAVGGLSCDWRVIAGAIELPKGFGKIRVGGVLPLFGPHSTVNLAGPAARPSGEVALVAESAAMRWSFAARWNSAAGLDTLEVSGPIAATAKPREGIIMNPAETGPSAPADPPVTLTVELGRLSLGVSKLADLKPGDTLPLGRHAREPVELTSAGRLVARAELVQIDDELGIRIIHIFM